MSKFRLHDCGPRKTVDEFESQKYLDDSKPFTKPISQYPIQSISSHSHVYPGILISSRNNSLVGQSIRLEYPNDCFGIDCLVPRLHIIESILIPLIQWQRCA